jgi:hypothetical protein
MSYLKVNSYQGKWNIKNKKGAIAIQTEDGISHSTGILRKGEYMHILQDFGLADTIQYDPESTQYITTKNF